MSRRITAENVRVQLMPLFDEMPVTAFVKGANREYVVDRYDGKWFCTCRVSTAHAATECAHIRATKEAIA